MQIFPTAADDLLDHAALQKVYDERVQKQPNAPEPELNYRTRPLSPDQELRLTTLVLLGPVPVLLTLASLLNGLISLHDWFLRLTIAVGLLLAGAAIVRHLIGATIRILLTALVLLAAAFLCGRLWSWIDGLWWCRLSLVFSWLLSGLMARQIAAWIVVGPTVDQDRLERWQGQLPELLRPILSLDCPELLTFSLIPVLIPCAWWSAVRFASGYLGQMWLWPATFVICLHGAWWLWHVVLCLILPWPSWNKSWQITLQGLVTFLTYDPHQTPAAGLFRFPTHVLRPVVVRWVVVVGVLLSLAFACSSSTPTVMEAWRDGRSPLGQMAINLLLWTVEAPLLLVTIFWMIAGTTLARFELELSQPPASGATEWDIYVDRIVNSRDELEQEHILVGTTRTGDYPVLVHREIYDQHLHLTGDSGASKTSLGMTPLATQLIARGDASVVVIDLKGDKALFEACQIEAARTRQMRFRWVSNQVGQSSYAFNPFQQNHNQQLSIQQFVQEILQGLSLDHGIAYGAGYYTAMNEIVLTTILQHCRARSFRELDRYLKDQRFYAKIGHPEDWAQARHLGSLVTRLAATEAVNIVPGMYPAQPAVLADAIDAQNVYTQPQVVYLWLRSAVESSNAPAIARLFLWSMFNAATQFPPGEHRVYFLIDEFQQVISEGIRLIFEQFRDLGGTLVVAHQAEGQLHRHGADLGDTVDSCTAVKQVFRASGLESLDNLEKLSGSKLENVTYWMQPKEPGTGNLIERLDSYHAVDGLVNVRAMEQPRLNRRQLQEISSHRQASLIRFTFGSGYTQFAGATVPIVSEYSIARPEYDRRRTLPWPTAPGAFIVPATPMKASTSHNETRDAKLSDRPQGAAGFVQEFERRGKSVKP